MPQVSVIIPTIKGREHLLKRLLDSLPKGVETIVVPDENLLLAAKRNKGAKLAKGNYLLFIDDDNCLRDGAIDNMIREFQERTGAMGMVACYDDKKMLVSDGGSYRSYISGFTWGVNTNAKIYGSQLYFNYLVDEVANAFMVKREVFELLGGFDEKNFPIELDEADLCKRIKNMGYEIEMNVGAITYHHSQTYSCVPDFRRPLSAYFMGRNRILFQKKHLCKPKLFIYFIFFFPIFVSSYCACLLWRKKPDMVVHFLKGVTDGLLNRKKNKYQ